MIDPHHVTELIEQDHLYLARLTIGELMDVVTVRAGSVFGAVAFTWRKQTLLRLVAEPDDEVHL